MEPNTTTEEAPTAIAQTTSVITTETPKHTRVRPLVAFLAGVLVAVGGYIAYDRLTVDAVAIVNDGTITQAELDESVELMKKSAEMQGADVTDPKVVAELRTQALANLVNNELLMGAARRAGITANEASVQTAYDKLVTQIGGEDKLKERMTAVGLTPEVLRVNIGDRLMVDQYIEAETDIENLAVTPEEVDAYIQSITSEGVTLPPLEDIRGQIETTILGQKQEEIASTLIEKLRGEAKIKIIE